MSVIKTNLGTQKRYGDVEANNTVAFKFSDGLRLAGIHSSHSVGLRSIGFLFHNLSSCQAEKNSTAKELITYVEFQQ